MPVFQSRLKPKSEAFARNRQRMVSLLDEVQRLEKIVIAESESKRTRFEDRGQLLPRERVARLLDRGSPFLEISRLAGLGGAGHTATGGLARLRTSPDGRLHKLAVVRRTGPGQSRRPRRNPLQYGGTRCRCASSGPSSRLGADRNRT